MQQKIKIDKTENVKLTEKLKPKNLEESKDSSNVQESDDEDENMNILINSLKHIVDPKEEHKAEEEFFEEEGKDRVYARFLTPEGKKLPGLSDHDTIGYRIEALRVYLEQQLSEQTFIKAYKLLQVINIK